MDDSVASAERSLNISDAYHDRDFCSGEKESIASCALYLHQELRVLGLPSVLDRESHQLDTPRLLNTVHRLLHLHRSSHFALDELRTSLQRSRSDVTMQTEIQDRLKDDLHVAERELAMAQEKERQLNLKIKSISGKLRAEQDEVRRLKASIHYKEAQHSHEMRKREKEYSRLKMKLGQLVSDRSQERRLGLSVLNALQRSDGKRKLWNQPGSSTEDTYRAIVSSYEERQKAMLVENASLRESLSAIQTELVSLLNEQQGRRKQRSSGEEEEEEEGKGEFGVLSSGHFQMPYDIVRDGIEKTFREHLQRIREHLQSSQSAVPSAGSEAEVEGGEEGEGDMSALRHKLSDYRDIIGRQEELLQKTASGPKEVEGEDLLSESWLWKERDRLEVDKAELQEHRDNVEQDRQLVMEAAKKLDRERQTFEDDKLAFLKEQFLDSSVFNSTSELDSFYSKLSSTPAHSTVSAPFSVSAPSIRLDLCHDLSLCSDEGSAGVRVLNYRQDLSEAASEDSS